MKTIITQMMVFLLTFAHISGCKKRNEENRVNIKQIEIDNSNNYRYIFKDLIKKDEARRRKYKKDVFQEE